MKQGRVLPPAIGDGQTVRLTCCVPFCRRTFRNDKNGTPWPEGAEVMCGKHWRTGPVDLRARDKQLRRTLRRIDRLMDAKKRYKLGCLVFRWINQNWERARDIIKERAAGIA